MIPIVILVGLIAGLIAGRTGWWAVAVVAVAWPIVLIATDVGSGIGLFAGAGLLAAINTGVGVAVGIGVRWLVGNVAGRIRTHA